MMMWTKEPPAKPGAYGAVLLNQKNPIVVQVSFDSVGGIIVTRTGAAYRMRKDIARQVRLWCCIELPPIPKEGTLEEAMQAVWDAGGSEWAKHEDPEKLLREIRGVE